jgi:uncharacterized membrane protein YdjX (TVP38/TMEM64 family)
LPTTPPHPDRRAALLRLGSLVVGLACLFSVFVLGGFVGADAIRDWIAPAGAFAPLAFVLIGGLLGALLVPGAALAAASGLLFGAVGGAFLALPSAVVSAVVARSFSARTGGDALEAVSGERLNALVGFARRHGFAAVVVQRLLPVVPDGPLSHAFGLAGVRARDVALGTLVASGPRALSYALLGANADDLTGTGAIVGVALNVGTGALGLLLAAVVVRQERRRVAAEARAEAETVAAGPATSSMDAPTSA